MRLEYEGLHQTEAISLPGNRFYQDAEGYAMERYAYYVCYRCNKVNRIDCIALDWLFTWLIGYLMSRPITAVKLGAKKDWRWTEEVLAALANPSIRWN